MNQAKLQQGATLLVSLVMLLILTLAGLSAVENISLQTHMARNSQYSIHTYQIALSEIQAQLEDLDINIAPLNAATINGTENRSGGDISMQPAKFTQTVSYEYIGEGLPPTGYSVDTFVGRIYELDSRAQLDNTGIFSDQTQGLNYAGPK